VVVGVRPTLERVRVAPDGLRRHASIAETVAADVGQASRAGAAVRLDTGAYGQLCAHLVAMIDPLQDLVVDTMQRTARGVAQAADQVVAVAVDTERTDHEVARRFGN
jgi:excreted virulence factor EspC (type VII ESX diderm)